ncbi:MAG: M48 family metallopeptidase [Candidatus Methylopumilus sp.]|jgi:predicted Zn-dependent protease
MKPTRTLLLLLAISLPTMPAYAWDLSNLNVDKLTSTLSKVKDLQTVDEPSEIQIGNGVAANLLGAAPLVKDDKLQAYVNRLGWWLAQQTERPDLPWHFGVLDSDSVNAFAAPGGYVFITKGLLLRMRNEAELAGVMAHEISHVLRKHHLNAIQKSAQLGLAADAASMAVSSSDNAYLKDKAISAGSEVLARGLDKDDEFEADRMGVVIAARAGYDPYGLPSVLQTLDAMNPQDDSLALMFKTHPTPQKRLELLDGAMTGTMDKYVGQVDGKERFMKVVGEYAKK